MEKQQIEQAWKDVVLARTALMGLEAMVQAEQELIPEQVAAIRGLLASPMETLLAQIPA